jgi:hypothetical protein
MFGNPRLISQAQPTRTANPTRKNLSHQALAWSLGGPRFDYSSQSKLRVEVRICDFNFRLPKQADIPQKNRNEKKPS